MLIGGVVGYKVQNELDITLVSLLKQASSFSRLELSQFDQGTATMPTLVGAEDVKHFTLPISSRAEG